jgi:GT2 family glycosyltransferase
MITNLNNNLCGVVILNYNTHDLTVSLAKKISAFKSVNFICVVDNCSHDDFDEDFSEAKIYYIKSGRNVGYSAGNNIGLRYLIDEKKCGYVFIANPDVDFEDETIKVMHETMLRNSNIALLSTKRYGNNNETIHQWFDFPLVSVSVKNCFLLPRIIFEKRRRFIQNMIIDVSEDIVYVDAVPGAFFGIKSEFLKKNNFLYEGIFLYGEEIILGRQARNMGYRVGVINTEIYTHNHVKRRFSNIKAFIYDRKSLKIYYRNFMKLNILQRLFLNIAIILGTAEYSCAYAFYNTILKGIRK